MKIKTSELKDRALDWAVAKCIWTEAEWLKPDDFIAAHSYGVASYHTDWSCGGPIIDRKGIFLTPGSENMWPSARTRTADGRDTGWINGETTLIAAMRCLVISELGDEVDVPEELM